MVASITIIVLLGFAAWRDVATRTIPDLVSIAIVAVGVVVRSQQGWQPLAASIGVASVVFLCLIPLVLLGVFGGADMKLLSALALGSPPFTTLELLTDVTLFGALLACVYLGLRFVFSCAGIASAPLDRRSSAASRLAAIECWRIRKRAPLPYGLAIAAGATFVAFGPQGV